MGHVYFFDNSPGILKIVWTKNGEKINTEESDGKLSETRTDKPSLTIRNVSPDDAGEYQLTAMNAVGLTTSLDIVLGILVINFVKYNFAIQLLFNFIVWQMNSHATMLKTF